jgi:hypothetical protein
MSKSWSEIKAKKELVVAEVKSLKEHAGSDSTALAAVSALSKKLEQVKNWPPDSGTEKALITLHTTAVTAVKHVTEAPKITVSLTKTSKPKFMHNASASGGTSAGTKFPVWSFSFKDTVSGKTGEVDITMTSAMTKDENTAKKLMAEAAIAAVQKVYPKGSVTMVSSTMTLNDK